MNIDVIFPQLGDGTDGLASAYQRTQVTGAGYAAAQDTAGGLIISVISIPSWRLVPPPSSPTEERQVAEPLYKEGLASQMVRDMNFKQLVERGLADLDQGRHSKLEDVKRRLGDI